MNIDQVHLHRRLKNACCSLLFGKGLPRAVPPYATACRRRLPEFGRYPVGHTIQSRFARHFIGANDFTLSGIEAGAFGVCIPLVWLLLPRGSGASGIAPV